LASTWRPSRALEEFQLENPAPPSSFSGAVRLVARPDVIHQGEKVVLRWNAPNMPEVTLEQAVDPMEDIPGNVRDDWDTSACRHS
jgi:hypothetical protein